VLDRLPCRLVDPELFFAESPADVESAKALCRGCPLQAECLAGALERGEPWGVWGGQLFVHGAVVARKRPRGRPRKVFATPPITEEELACARRPKSQSAHDRPERQRVADRAK